MRTVSARTFFYSLFLPCHGPSNTTKYAPHLHLADPGTGSNVRFPPRLRRHCTHMNRQSAPVFGSRRTRSRNPRKLGRLRSYCTGFQRLGLLLLSTNGGLVLKCPFPASECRRTRPAFRPPGEETGRGQGKHRPGGGGGGRGGGRLLKISRRRLTRANNPCRNKQNETFQREHHLCQLKRRITRTGGWVISELYLLQRTAADRHLNGLRTSPEQRAVAVGKKPAYS